jgi:hypothetical protein
MLFIYLLLIFLSCISDVYYFCYLYNNTYGIINNNKDMYLYLIIIYVIYLLYYILYPDIPKILSCIALIRIYKIYNQIF